MEEYKKEYYTDGVISYEHYCKEGKYHREDGPARIFYYDNIHYINRSWNKYSEGYYKDGELHRENLPALIYYHSLGQINHEHYFKAGRHHREDGPAWLCYITENKTSKRYFLNDVEYTDKDIIDNWKEFCKIQIFI